MTAPETPPAYQPAARRGVVAPYPRAQAPSEHELASQDLLARRIAALLNLDVALAYRPGLRPRYGSVYFVPARTIVGRARASTLGIDDETDLYGGVVPHAFVATKSISHPLLNARARAPSTWSRRLGTLIEPVTLAGYTAFSLTDAQRAGVALLQRGPIRVKQVEANAGRGQEVVRSAAELEAALARLQDATVRRLGLVLEENLAEVETYSVGTLRIGTLEAAYVGTQSLTDDNQGEQVYGGSTLRVVRGGWDALLAHTEDARERQAVQQSREYDAAVQECYPELLASRRNYDVAIGQDAHGQTRAGVLEQSWRAGGASLAEIAALEAFADDAALDCVNAFTRERYGQPQITPPGRHLVFHAYDSTVGFISKSGGLQAPAQEPAHGAQ
ncbi:DUF3182 family protein [Bordetella genomosp. 1]|uniref:Biotin carboxylase n=1 Tax=Bordetella genomosp. 1 TaxID=1395607 RepID=A0ABX4EXK0_9BORD|nr:DUF3182 family protein [Bordetella genomosp. 1]OZI63812.1 biotin carboxylase [Bordetella genomosp. 1]